ncbi:MAG: DNA repair protein RecO [Nitrospirota bacterium]
MPLTRIQAVILGSLRLGEANRLVTFLTPGRGRLTGMAYNARRPNRRFGSALELFTHCELVMAERRPHHHIDLRQAVVIQGFPSIRGDLSRIEAASRLVMLCRAFLPEASPHPAAFGLLIDTLAALNQGRAPWLTVRLFEVGLLRDTGYEPRLDRCVRCQREWRQEPAGALFFTPHGGGLLCRRCASAGADAAEPLRILPGAAAFLRQAARLGLDKGGRLQPSVRVCQDVDALLQCYLRVLLDRQPFSDRLESLNIMNNSAAPASFLHE